MLKTGDKVRFLNAVGGGIVRRVDKDIVLVEEEDGFETPVLARECVVIEPAKKQDNDIVPEYKKESPRRAPQTFSLVDEDEPRLPIYETSGGDKINLYMAFVPEEDCQLSRTTFDLYLINESNYFIDYVIMHRVEDDRWVLHSRGEIEPNIQLHIIAFGHESVSEYEHFLVQAIAYKRGKSFDYKEPVSIVLRNDPVKFHKLHTFAKNDFFDKNAWIIPLIEKDVPNYPLHIDETKLADAMCQKNDNHSRPIKQSRKQLQDALIEVDLHIHELVDTTSGMSNYDMLQLQLKTFRDTLDAHRREKGRKIVFIHGKGDGVLRKAILDELQRKYKNYDYQDASFREYGFGATQVTIR